MNQYFINKINELKPELEEFFFEQFPYLTIMDFNDLIIFCSKKNILDEFLHEIKEELDENSSQKSFNFLFIIHFRCRMILLHEKNKSKFKTMEDYYKKAKEFEDFLDTGVC